jgi:uncharacterized Zn finger protein (UPF0148 family)
MRILEYLLRIFGFKKHNKNWYPQPCCKSCRYPLSDFDMYDSTNVCPNCGAYIRVVEMNVVTNIVRFIDGEIQYRDDIKKPEIENKEHGNIDKNT